MGENAHFTTTLGNVHGPQAVAKLDSGIRPSGSESRITCVNFKNSLGWLGLQLAGNRSRLS